MNINTTTLQNLDANSSYYLSRTGEIKRSGIVQWLKCFFNVGDGRAKAAALADRVKAALLADGGVESDAALNTEIAALNTTRSLSGSELRQIATRFRANHAVAVGRADARRTAAQLAETTVDAWAEQGWINKDPQSVIYMKRLAVYAAAPVIQRAADYATPEALSRALQSNMQKVENFVGSAGHYSLNSKLGYPVDWKFEGFGSQKRQMSDARLKLDELHFRLILACMTKAGVMRLDALFQNLIDTPEDYLQAMSDRILALPLKAEDSPDVLVEFSNAFMAAHNEQCLSAAGSKDGMPANSFNRATKDLLEEMRTAYGANAVPEDVSFYTLVPHDKITTLMKPAVDTANAQNRLLRSYELKDALGGACREGAAAAFLKQWGADFASKNEMGDVDPSIGVTLLEKDPALRKEILGCKSVDEANAVMEKYADVVRAQIAPQANA